MKRLFFCALLATACLLARAKRQLIVGVAEERKENSASVLRSYVNAIERGGHIPLIIPDGLDERALCRVLRKIDVLLLPGGDDVSPARYGHEPSPHLGEVNLERDGHEWRLLSEAVGLKKPIVGICRGMQMLNVFLGGTLYQDLPSEYPDTTLHHRQSLPSSQPTHLVITSRTSRLYGMTGCDTLRVNSHHHQAVQRLAPGLRVAARATDGVIEAVECDSLPIVGVQFHPERLATGTDTLFTRLFRELRRYAKR